MKRQRTLAPWPCRFLTLFLTLLLGCAADRTPPIPTLTRATAPAEEPYRLQVGDLLAIKFYRNPELNEEVRVRPDGRISLQLIDDVVVAGLTPTTLDAELTRRYAAELAEPQITVIVREVSTQQVYVGGEVGRPGVVPLGGGMTLFQVIQEAGSFLTTAHRKQIVVIRRGADGGATGHTIDLRPVASGDRPGEDVPLRPFDVVFVPRSKIANVNLFVEQYIRNMIPTFPGFAITPF